MTGSEILTTLSYFVHMKERLESMLTGGHPNSLGRTEEVVDLVLADQTALSRLYDCYFSTDEIVRLRCSSAMKRVAQVRPDWVAQLLDGLQTEIADIDQASTQWTLATLFDLTRELQDATQRDRSIEIMQRNLAEHDDWIVLNTTMAVLHTWSQDDPELSAWLQPHLARLAGDRRKAVRKRATTLLAAPLDGAASSPRRHIPAQPLAVVGRYT